MTLLYPSIYFFVADAENTELTTDPLLEETHETEASHAPLCTETALKDYNPDTEQLFNAYLQIKSRVSRFANLTCVSSDMIFQTAANGK